MLLTNYEPNGCKRGKHFFKCLPFLFVSYKVCSHHSSFAWLFTLKGETVQCPYEATINSTLSLL